MSSGDSELRRMLRNMPPDWRRQYDVGRVALYNATGRRLPDVPTPAQAATIVEITAGGRPSHDTVTGTNSVPVAVREAALHGLRLSYANNYGAWAFIGLARAFQLVTADGVSDMTISRMRAYFRRHASDTRAIGFGDDHRPSRGYMAWLNWGGDAGLRWVS